jgi:hypothetical protein
MPPKKRAAVEMCGNEDPKPDPWDLQSGIYEGDGFHPRHLLPDDRTGVFVPPVLRFSSRRKRQPFLQSPHPIHPGGLWPNGLQVRLL